MTGDDSIFDSDAMDDHPTRENDIEIVGTEVVDETITIEINDSDGKNELSDEIQEEASSNLLRLQTKWNSPGVPKSSSVFSMEAREAQLLFVCFIKDAVQNRFYFVGHAFFLATKKVYRTKTASLI